MKTERWQQINDLFQSAAERAPDERAAFLDEACHGDEHLCHDVKLLIASYERTENFIEAPAFEEAPELLTNDRAGALVGELVGHYRIESLIGVGGMGEVYLARDELLGRKVALKFLPQSLTEDEAQLNRLEHEARTASALNHPNILTVHEIGIDGRRHFIATEFIEGETLRAVLTRGKLDLRDALNIAIQVGSALAAAHKSAVLHRDIKPENIMLRPDGYVKVLDFGIAKLSEQNEAPSQAEMRTNATSFQTQSDLIFGTAHYMSPEQARGQTVDARTDIWSFGVVLFEMLSGRPPFEGKTPSECIAAVQKREPPLLALKAQQVPARAEQIVRKALRKDKEERYQSVEEMLADLRHLKESSESPVSGWERQRKITALLAASVAVALVVASLFIYLRPTRTVTNNLPGNTFPPASVISEKSIAVLPFKTLSNDQRSAHFADGVQDEILTALAKIADLKVISRTSVLQYTEVAKRNLPEIAQALRVAHVLEASVQRTDNRVRVNARLIDARSDVHLWAQTYDRDLKAVFAIQSEIAKTVAAQLRAKVLPVEQAAIEEPPTADLTAFDLYTRARTLLLTANLAVFKNQLLQAAELLDQAVARDPGFFQAHCQLAFVHDRLYFLGDDPTPNRLALAEAAIQAATRLRPDDGETHLAVAQHLYNGYSDYDRARAEIALAQRTLPNDPRLFALAGYIDRRQGRWDDSASNLEHAFELDPRNFYILHQISFSHQMLRRYSEMAVALDRALAIAPQDVDTRVKRALVDLHWRADTHLLHATIDNILLEQPAVAAKLAEDWVILAFCERDLAAAERALQALTGNNFGQNVVTLTRNFGEGLLARLRGNIDAAQTAFIAARAEQEEVLRARPEYAPALCVLGLIDAALGRRQEALREGRRAVELLPVAKDPVNGAQMIAFFSITAAWAGEKDLAIEQLKAATQVPGLLSYGQLKLLPFWDPLRGDPRFEQIVASVALEPVRKSAPDRSIAVLPFENLSRDPDNAFFTDGVQDEILTNLSRVAHLKVISRTSVMQYKSGVARNLRKIGQQLGVGHVVEGSVQRSGNRVRVNAQLIDARSDRHLWAQTYDRDLTDVFAIQSEIAEHIVSQLRSKLSPQEKEAIEKEPTADLAAHDLYIRAKILIAASHYSTPRVEILLQAVHLLNQAIERDPAFALAYYQLAHAHDQLYFGGVDHTPARLALADAAIQSLARLRPNSGEAHLALAKHLYWGYLDYDHARAELSLAQKSLPNEPWAFVLAGFIDRRQGRWVESIKSLEHAIELDPQNGGFLGQLAFSYSSLRRYTDAERILNRAIALVPKDPNLRVARAAIELDRHADPHPLISTIEGIVAQDSREAPNLAGLWIFVLLCERDFNGARRALAVLSIDGCYDDNVPFPRAWCEGVVAQMRGDKAAARAAFTSARTDAAKLVAEQPEYAEAHCVLGMADAALGNKEDAISGGRRSVELLPVTKDAMGGAVLMRNLAIIYAWTGEKDLAFEQLAIAAGLPGSFSYGQLKLMPFWDPLRGDPRFEKIVASLAPKE